jgi:hypothetical protein
MGRRIKAAALQPVISFMQPNIERMKHSISSSVASACGSRRASVRPGTETEPIGAQSANLMSPFANRNPYFLYAINAIIR